MLTRTSGVAPRQEYYNDSSLTKPTVGYTFERNFSATFATPFVMMDDVANTLSSKPTGNAMRDTLAAVEMENQTPGMGWLQRQVGNVASLVGYGVNPVMWGFGQIGGLAARGITAGAERLAPDAVSAFARTPLKDMMAQPVSRWLPEKAGTLSAGLLGEKGAKAFGIFAGAEIPPAVVENYNNDTNHINWGGFARDAGQMGSFGVAIGSIPFALGMVGGKINRVLGPGEIDASRLDQALEGGHITDDEHKWYSDYLELQKNPGDTKKIDQLKKQATEIINRNGGQADVVKNEARFDMLKADAIKQLQSVTPDELVSDVSENYKNALSGFVIHNGLDRLGDNPQMLDGVRGYVDWIGKKLAAKNSKLKDADDILDRFMLKGMRENMPFSQKELSKMMEKNQFNENELKSLPFVFPENVIKYLKNPVENNLLSPKDELNQLRQKLLFSQVNLKNFKISKTLDNILIQSDHGRINLRLLKEKSIRVEGVKIPEFNGKFSRGKGHGKQLYLAALKYAKNNGLKFFSDNQVSLDAEKVYKSLEKMGYEFKKNETTYLQERNPRLIIHYATKDHNPVYELISYPKSRLIKNWENSPEYHRLLDLSEVWGHAKNLLDRVQLEHDYESQQAFHDLLKQVLDIHDSDMPALANPDNVINYLKARIEGNINKETPVTGIQEKTRESLKIPSDAETVLKDQAEMVKQSKAKSLNEEFDAASEKFTEFKAKPEVFKNYIACVLGGLGG